MSDADEHDPLEALRALPVHAPPPGADRAARAAFTESSAPWQLRTFFGVTRALVPVALAGVVGVYLSWAFAAALALQN